MPLLSDKTSSFALARTNVRISGNIKITIDSAGDVSLNSIDSSKELSSAQFKKFRVGPTNSFEVDVKRFMGSLPPEVMFAVKENHPDPVNTSKSLRDQLDLFYAMGATPLVSNQYDEAYAYSAPIWLRQDLPEYFVIMRVDEPIDFPYNDPVASGSIIEGSTYVVKGSDNYFITYNGNPVANNQTFVGVSMVTTFTESLTGTGNVILLDENKDVNIDRVEHFESIMKRAHVIKTFDLTEKSTIGKYIRNIINNNLFPTSPITVRFDGGLLTTWNGISYRDGIMASKGELLEEYWRDGQLQIEFEEFMTNGFQRQGIICPMLLNLEFLFDDDSTDNYTIPRYFGYYVNKIETATIQLDGQAAYDNRNTTGNTPVLKSPNKGFKYHSVDFFQNNDNGVRIYFDDIADGADGAAYVPSSTDNFLNRSFWIQGRDGSFYSIDQRGEQAFNTSKSDLVLRNKSINLGNLGGATTKRLQSIGYNLTENGKSYSVLTVNGELYPNDEIKIYWNVGVSSDAYGLFNRIIANDLSNRPFTVPANGTLLTFSGLDLTTQFEIGDEIEIKYGAGRSVMKTITSTPTYSAGDTTFNINSAIDATTTSGYTPIVALWGPGSAMTSADNSTIYYHPYGTTAQIASAIASAINLIETRSFEALVVDNEVVIRMKSGTASSNNFFLMCFMTNYSRLDILGETPTGSTKHYFEGGTDRSNIRLKFPIENIDKLKAAPDVYISSNNGIAKINFVGRFVDDDDLAGFNTYGALTIEDIKDTPSVGSSGFFIAYELYRIPVGLFSFFAVKEIDGDFFSSTYSRSPIAEYYRYFDMQPETPYIFVPGRRYLVIADSAAAISYLGTTITRSSANVAFTAGGVTGETVATGNGAIKTFTFTFEFPPVVEGSITITGASETFTDDGDGNLIGTLSGTGTVNYETGDVSITFTNAIANGATATASYTSYAGYTVTGGTPFVVPEIFYNRIIREGTDTANLYGTIENGVDYLVFGNGTDTINYNTVSYAGSANGTPFTGSTSSIYEITAGNPLVVKTVADGRTLDEDLRSFPGFWKMKEFSTVRDENLDRSSLEFLNREKFVHLDLLSEYDYLKENYSISTAIKSKLVPYISKWVYKNGSDIRDNDYRLNTHPVFGTFNFSPAFIIKEQNPDAFTHEWYYLEQGPQNYPRTELANNYYFFYDKIDLTQLTDATPGGNDYFSDYFTFVAAKNVDDQERYSVLEFNKEIGFAETLFRGVKMRAVEIIRDSTVATLRGIRPPAKANSTRFSDYKFSALLRVKKEDPTKVQAPVEIQFIENKTHKTITMVIDVIIEDYRTLTLTDPTELGSSVSPEFTYPESLDVSLDYLLLYSMKSKKSEATYDNTTYFRTDGINAFKIGDIKLSVALNLGYPSEETSDYTIVHAFDNADYDWDLRDEVKNFKRENVFEGTFLLGDTLFPFPLESTQTTIKFGIPGETYAQSVDTYDDFLAPNPSVLTVPFGSNFYWKNYPTVQINGGNLYLEPIMQRISFGRIAERVNEYSPIVKYRTFKWNGTATVEATDEFYIEMIEPSQFNKHFALVPTVDEDKPEEFRNEQIIGVAHQKVNYVQLMMRYGGPYEPKFRPILFFQPQKSDAIESSPDFDLSFKQATFNPNVAGFGIIKNQGYLKVSNRDVLVLSRNPKFKPRYPLLDETPISTQNIFMFGSSWDPGFWRKHTSKNTYELQAGTRELMEVKNFMGTKIMKTPESLRVQTFDVADKQPTLDLLNMDTFSEEVFYTVTKDNKIQGLINLRKRFLRFLVEDGASAEFDKYLLPEFGTGDPDSLDDDVIEYLELNVLPTYEVKLTDFYIKKYKTAATLDLVVGNLTDAQKLSAGYSIDRNFTVQKKSDFVYFFEMAVDPNFNVSLAPSFTIGKI